VHSALEEYYRSGTKRGPHPRLTFEKLYEETTAASYAQGFRDEDGTWHNMGELGPILLDAYVEQWGEDNRWYVLATEQAFRVKLVDPVSGLEFTFVGVIDLVMRDRASGKRKEVWLWDHKTCKDDPTKKAAALILDEQSSSYWKYGVMWLREQGVIKAGTNLQGMYFNFLRKGKPDERPKNALGQALNKDGSVSKVQPSPLFHREPVFRGEYDGEMVHKRTLAQARMMHYLRQGKLELTKTPGTLHSPHCNWCEFRSMCELHETGGDWETIKKFEFDKWEPYAQHEIEVGEKV
jgi:PD-(D/E)XK nuclease superfamily